MLVFIHNQDVLDRRHTIALDFDFNAVKSLVSDFIFEVDTETYLPIKVGVARTHPKDRYVKAIGRKVATDNMKDYEFRVKSVVATEAEITVNFESHQESGVYISISLKNKKHIRVQGYSWREHE